MRMPVLRWPTTDSSCSPTPINHCLISLTRSSTTPWGRALWVKLASRWWCKAPQRHQKLTTLEDSEPQSNRTWVTSTKWLTLDLRSRILWAQTNLEPMTAIPPEALASTPWRKIQWARTCSRQMIGIPLEAPISTSCSLIVWAQICSRSMIETQQMVVKLMP